MKIIHAMCGAVLALGGLRRKHSARPAAFGIARDDGYLCASIPTGTADGGPRPKEAAS
jgi:hypothetical protein